MADWLRIAAIYTAAALIARAPALLYVELNWDEALYWRIAGELLDGDPPYTRTWDRKPPGLYVLMAAWRSVVGDSIGAMRLGTTTAVVAGALALRAIGGRLMPGVPGLGTLAGLFYVAGSMRGAGAGTNAELLLAPFALASMALALAAMRSPRVSPRVSIGRAVAAGVLGGCALLIKPVAIGEGVVVLVLLLLRRLADAPPPPSAARLLAMMAAGVLAPLALMAGWYGAIGHLPLLLQVLLAAGEAGQGTLDVQGLMNGVREFALPAAGTLGGVALLAVGRAGHPARGAVTAIVIWVVAVASVLAMLGRFADHMMLQLLAPLALGSAVFVVLVASMLPTVARRQGLVLGATTLLAFGWGVGGAANAGIETVWRRHMDGLAHWGDRTATLAAVLHDRTGASDGSPGGLYVAGRMLGLYHASATVPPTRFPFVSHLWAPYAPVDGAAEITRIMAGRPSFVVVDDLWLPGGPRSSVLQALVLDRLAAALATEYVAEGRTGRFVSWGGGFVGGGIGATVFRRADLPPWQPGAERLSYEAPMPRRP